MQTSILMRLALRSTTLLAVIFTSCTRPNPEFCDENTDCNNGEICSLDINRCIAAPPDTTCVDDADCPVERPVCGDDAACRSCLADDECGSEVCRSDGTCEAADRILYVRPNGLTSGTCTAADRCDLTYARSLVSAERQTIRLADGTYTLSQQFRVDGGASLTVVGSRAASLQFTGVGPAVGILGVGTKAHLRGFTIHQGATCSNATFELVRMAFNNPGGDVRSWIAASGCTLVVTDSTLSDSLEHGISQNGGDATVTGTTIERSAGNGVDLSSGTAVVKTSTITRNGRVGITGDTGRVVVHRSIVSANRLGGIRSTNGSFEIVNNFVFRNGDPGQSTFGGMHLDSNSSSSRVMHNTVMYNDCDVNVSPPLSGGLYCRIGASGTAYGNLIAQNYRGNTSLQNAQTGGSCDFTYSLIAENPLAPVNFGCVLGSDMCRLAGGGAAIDAGMQLGVTEDFDGQPRSDGKPDIGADEYHP